MDKLNEMHQLTADFLKARKWDSLSAGDLTKAIAIEVAELMEHFQWSESFGEDESEKEELGLEVADILFYLITFCLRKDIDMYNMFKTKLNRSKEKYPASAFKEKHDKKFYSTQKKKYRAANNSK